MNNYLLDFLFPPKCPFCKKILSSSMPICHDCIAKLPYVTGNKCRICRRPLAEFSYNLCPSCRAQKRYFKYSFVPLIYKNEVRSALLAFKYYYHPYYAKVFAFLLANKILSSEHYISFDFITYVPQNSVSKFLRGYNQAKLICKELSRILNIPYISTLGKNNKGQNQATIKNADLRRENVKKSYYSKGGSFSGKVLLVDDIYTTGFTANYCSKLLLQMGFSEVYLAVVAIRSDL